MTQLLQNAAYGTALILAAAALRRVLKGRLIPEARLALWAVCLFRLLTPAAPESVLSLWGFFRPRQAPAAPAPVTGTPQLYTPPQAVPQASPAISRETVLLAVWLSVAIVLAVRYVLSWTRTRRAVACAIPVGQADPRYAPLPRCARLREGPMEGAPLTFGAVKPTVVLSPGLSGDALDCVLAHEGVHAQRRDNLWHYAMALALAVHWWNPAVWLMARLLRRDIELSCDRAALRKLGAERRADYANTLVTLATQGDGPAFCQTFGRKVAEERIRSVMKFKKTSVIGAILSLALVLAVTAAFASEPKELDTYDSVKVNTSVELGDVTLPGDAAKYASQLHAGMTRDEVHQLLGEPSFSMSRPYNDTYELDDTQKPQLGIFYDVDGTVIQVKYFSDGTDPNCTGIDLPPFLTASGEDQPTYQDISDYKVVLPEVDENGVSRVYDDEGNLIAVGTPRTPFGTPLCDGSDCDIANPHIHYDGQVIYVDYQDPYTDPVPVPSVAPAKTFDDYTIVGMDENGYPLDEQGNHLVFDENGGLLMKSGVSFGLCVKEDCDISEAHYHRDGEVFPCLESNAPAPVFEPDVSSSSPDLAALHDTLRDQWEDRIHDQISETLLSRAGSTSCGVAGCTETRYHAHNEGRTILLNDPCPVEGCTITGNHIHDGTVYSCNGAGHDGGVCDGSCYTYN